MVTAPAAGAAPAPRYTYSSSVTAIGLQTALFSQPEPSSVPDLTDVQTPSSDAALDSFGTSDASAHVGNLNGLGVLPSLICLASSAFCKAVPIATLTGGTIKNFPPADPLDAQSTYPGHQHATAPTIGAKKASVKVHNGPLTVGQGTASSYATALATGTSAVDSNVGVVGGMSIGSIRTSTKQLATTTGLESQAISDVSNINIGTGHLLHIDSVRSTVTVNSVPGKPAVDHATSQVSGVKVLGKSATIDSKGVHVTGGPGVPKAVTAAYQKALDTIFAKAGFGLRKASIKRSNGHIGHTVSVAGLEVFISHTVKGAPPITVGLPAGVPCPISLPSAFPLSPCGGVGLDVNAHYRGQIALGQAGVVSFAQPAAKTPSLPPGSGTGPVKGGSHVSTGVGSTGAGGPAGSAGGITTGPTTTSGAASGGQAPTIAGTKASAVLDPLQGLSGRLWWFFPLAAIGVLSLVGRLRLPARLPSQ